MQIELLPVKRTVKNQKILATSNRNVAGCFFVESRHCFTESAMKDVSQASPEMNRVFPRRSYAARRYELCFSIGVSTPNLLWYLLLL